MPEITNDRLMTLLGSAKANIRNAQVEIYHYEGAIQTLQLLIDDLKAQEIKQQMETERAAQDKREQLGEIGEAEKAL